MGGPVASPTLLSRSRSPPRHSTTLLTVSSPPWLAPAYVPASDTSLSPPEELVAASTAAPNALVSRDQVMPPTWRPPSLLRVSASRACCRASPILPLLFLGTLRAGGASLVGEGPAAPPSGPVGARFSNVTRWPGAGGAACSTEGPKLHSAPNRPSAESAATGELSDGREPRDRSEQPGEDMGDDV